MHATIGHRHGTVGLFKRDVGQPRRPCGPARCRGALAPRRRLERRAAAASASAPDAKPVADEEPARGDPAIANGKQHAEAPAAAEGGGSGAPHAPKGAAAAAAIASQSAWGDAPGSADDEWTAAAPRTLKDVDWAMAALLGGILALSFGAYRILDAWGIYRHSRAGPGAGAPTAAAVDARTREQQQRRPRGGAPAAGPPTKQRQETGDAAAAAAAERGGGDAARERGADSQQQQQQDAAPRKPKAAKPSQQPKKQQKARDAGPGSQAAAAPQLPLGVGCLEGVPGAPQPSPLDQGFRSVEPPWAGRDLGDLSLAPLQALRGGGADAARAAAVAAQVQAERPAQAVDPSVLDTLQPDDGSVPGLRQRAHIAMRAAAAAMEASQRTVAYSAAASSAAARASEAAEEAAASAADVQAALEAAAADAMADAVARMNKAVEMVADAESRAAAAAATATAHQDVAESQAAVARAAADVPARVPQPRDSRNGGAGAGARGGVHAHLFTAWGILADAAGGAWQGLAAALAAAWAALAAAVANVGVALRLLPAGGGATGAGPPGAAPPTAA